MARFAVLLSLLTLCVAVFCSRPEWFPTAKLSARS